MIQRIQTVYLLLVAGLFIALLFLPLATVKSISETAKTVFLTFPLAITATVIAALSLIAVFLYRKRKVQRVVCLAVFLLILAFCILAGYYMVTAGKIQEAGQNAVITPSIWITFPVIACILSILAVNRISADEKLIRSLDRIR
jgi:Kef-type K+ transport system membrane component KefB